MEDVGADKGVLITTTGFTSGAEKRARAAGIDVNVMTLESAMETDWGEFLEDSCKTWMGCPGSINWDYSEGGPRFGTCDHCGQLHIECGECGHQDEYDVGCDRSIGNVHVRCKGCNCCLVVGVEKGDVTDISACTRHKAGAEVAGIAQVADGLWMSQIARNLTDAEQGILTGKRYLIHRPRPTVHR